MNHDHIHTRDQWKAKDPDLAALCADVLGDSDLRFVSPRTRADQGHLAGLDPATMPKAQDSQHIDPAAQDDYAKY
jgi:hypothetical protein